jgi:hypothetical protein
VSRRSREAGAAIAEGINIVGRGTPPLAENGRPSDSTSSSLPYRRRGRQQRWVQVQEGNQAVGPGERKFDLDFGLNIPARHVTGYIRVYLIRFKIEFDEVSGAET